MGISKAVGSMGTAFLVASLYMLKSGITLIPIIPLLYDSLVAYIVTFASHPTINFPLILGKNPDGKFPFWSKIIFGPFLVFVRIYVLFKRVKRRGKEPAYSEIVDGLFVGGWPSEMRLLPPGNPAVVDCTCELPRSNVVDKEAYLCVPTWDTRSPRPEQIESAVRWACKFRAEKKPVFVHCAFGHGRSVCVMCALLVALGVAEDWKNAEQMVRVKRPKIRMNANHRKNLEEWSKFRHLSKRGEMDDTSSETNSNY